MTKPDVPRTQAQFRGKEDLVPYFGELPWSRQVISSGWSPIRLGSRQQNEHQGFTGQTGLEPSLRPLQLHGLNGPQLLCTGQKAAGPAPRSPGWCPVGCSSRRGTLRTSSSFLRKHFFKIFLNWQRKILSVTYCTSVSMGKQRKKSVDFFFSQTAYRLVGKIKLPVSLNI